jgi:hypothetical protein
MRVLIGALLISLATFLFCSVLLCTRNPRQTKWASDGLIGNLYCPLMVSSGLVGIAFFISGLYHYSIYGTTQLELLIASAILLLTAIGIKAMKIKTRIAAYAKQAIEAAAKTNIAPTVTR